jgi:hypothetical protein
MVYFIELIRYQGHADRDPEGARAKAKNIFLQTKVGEAERVRVLNSNGVEILNWGPSVFDPRSGIER